MSQNQPSFSMRQLIEAGVHFGHKTKRWNPQMAPFIFGVRNDTHIIDLGQTVPMLHRALSAVHEVAKAGGKILFVGTKRQASNPVADAARSCNQYYINQRWLGGLMTNWQTIQASIQRLRKLEASLQDPEVAQALTKKELLNLERQRTKLEKSLGGIKDIGGTPDMLFIVDTHREVLAVQEANKLNIPIVGIVDTNASVDGITFPIPGNDDATRAINLYCELVASAVREGHQAGGIRPQTEKIEIVSNSDESSQNTKAEAPAKSKEKGKAEDVAAKLDAKVEKKKPAASSKTKKEALAEVAEQVSGKSSKAEKDSDVKKEDKPAAKTKKASPAKKASATKAKEDDKPEAKKPAAKKSAAKKAPAKTAKDKAEEGADSKEASSKDEAKSKKKAS